MLCDLCGQLGLGSTSVKAEGYGGAAWVLKSNGLCANPECTPLISYVT